MHDRFVVRVIELEGLRQRGIRKRRRGRSDAVVAADDPAGPGWRRRDGGGGRRKTERRFSTRVRKADHIEDPPPGRVDDIVWKIVESDAHHPFGNLTGKGGHHSPGAKRRSDHESAVASTRKPLIARRPAENDPVSSVSHPITYGPTNPPVVPIELMNARPPAAAMPVRKRGGMVQKIARAPLTPVTATAIHTTESQKLFLNRIAPRKPHADTAHDSARLTTLLAPRSTCPAHRIIPITAAR